MVEKVELKICDDDENLARNVEHTKNCRNFDVTVVGTGGGKGFWIDGDCDTHDINRDTFANGCDETRGCSCFKGKFYLRQVGDSWELNPKVGTECRKTCQDINPDVVNCWAPTQSFAYNNATDWWEATTMQGECGFQYQACD